MGGESKDSRTVDSRTVDPQTVSDFDLAWMIGIKLVESGLITPELREKLCEEQGIERVIASVIAVMKRELKVHASIPPDFVLREDEYAVYVDYKIPGWKRLLNVFPKKNKPYLLKEKYWGKHSSCKIRNFPRFCAMRIKSYEEKTTIDVAMADMESEEYRPATHLEAYAFAQTHTDMIRFGQSIVAFGSSYFSDNTRQVSVLDRNSHGLVFNSQSSKLEACHFLCVRHEKQPTR